jgi:hypothetical protein
MGIRGIALLFLNLGATRGGGWSAPRPGRFTPGKDSVPIVQEAGWAPGPVLTCAKNLAPTGIRSPDRSVRSLAIPTEPLGPQGVVCSVHSVRFNLSDKFFVHYKVNTIDTKFSCYLIRRYGLHFIRASSC